MFRIILYQNDVITKSQDWRGYRWKMTNANIQETTFAYGYGFIGDDDKLRRQKMFYLDVINDDSQKYLGLVRLKSIPRSSVMLL